MQDRTALISLAAKFGYSYKLPQGPRDPESL
jgi:hypothetical protein